MQNLIEFLSQPWPWYISGPLIAMIMFLMIYFGKTFGVSSTFRTACTIAGAGKYIPFFKMDWRNQIWNLVFIAGAVIGGLISQTLLSSQEPMALSKATVLNLDSLGIENPGREYLPVTLFSWESLITIKGWVFMILGGFLVGFGTRYAGGCTSGHGISGLSRMEPGSLVAVIGFFIGGLFMTYLILPWLLTL
jgi:hypothetical protein